MLALLKEALPSKYNFAAGDEDNEESQKELCDIALKKLVSPHEESIKNDPYVKKIKYVL